LTLHDKEIGERIAFGMERKLFDNRCPICGQGPKRDEQGDLKCNCGKPYVRIAGIEAGGKEARLLESHKFRLARTPEGDKYYIGPSHRLVWLYGENKWWGDPKPNPGMTLDEYLEEAA